jgi:predicted ABC-class ATPase
MNTEQKLALENHISKMKDIILNYALENANMRDRLEELGELEELIEDGSIKDHSSYSPV